MDWSRCRKGWLLRVCLFHVPQPLLRLQSYLGLQSGEGKQVIFPSQSAIG